MESTEPPESMAELRLQGSDLDPDEVTRVLGCVPTDAGRSGDFIEGSRLTAPTPVGWWRLVSDLPFTADMADHIAGLVQRLTDDLSAWEAVQRFGPDILCSLRVAETEGFELSIDTLRALADRGVTLSVDIAAAVISRS